MNKFERYQVNQLRTDARKLETVSKHLRNQAKEITKDAKVRDLAAQTRASFYSRQSKVDPTVVRTPVFEEAER